MKGKPMAAKGSSGKYPTEKGREARNASVPMVRSSAGLMSKNVTPTKGKGEF